MIESAQERRRVHPTHSIQWSPTDDCASEVGWCITCLTAVSAPTGQGIADAAVAPCPRPNPVPRRL